VERDEASGVEEFYRDHLGRADVRRRWAPDNPGNARAYQEREDVLGALLPKPVRGLRVVEVGCGSGGVLAAWLRRGGDPADVLGVDLLEFRLREAKERHPEIAFAVARGDALPVATASADVVLAYTLFSSVLDRGVAAAIAREMDRVLRPGGLVVLYDFRVSRPGSRTRGIRASEIAAMFPGYASRSRLVTLLPPLARRLGRATPVLYGPLSRLPLLRTHRLALLRKVD
jgi:SAM-dependent methyltransferase